jgi:hypothetical protein
MKASELIHLLQRIQSHTGDADTEIILTTDGPDRDIKLNEQAKAWNASIGSPQRPAAWIYTSQYMGE